MDSLPYDFYRRLLFLSPYKSVRTRLTEATGGLCESKIVEEMFSYVVTIGVHGFGEKVSYLVKSDRERSALFSNCIVLRIHLDNTKRAGMSKEMFPNRIKELSRKIPCLHLELEDVHAFDAGVLSVLLKLNFRIVCIHKAITKNTVDFLRKMAKNRTISCVYLAYKVEVEEMDLYLDLFQQDQFHFLRCKQISGMALQKLIGLWTKSPEVLVENAHKRFTFDSKTNKKVLIESSCPEISVLLRSGFVSTSNRSPSERLFQCRSKKYVARLKCNNGSHTADQLTDVRFLTTGNKYSIRFFENKTGWN
ncbi:hypothetical protein QR680_014441 [Steinernema hermaphroditum]|uniref:Uncharacterized protein n=1 Tax=Steinernema hermaphroditum TaxID=289476 RepID=A0AA39IB67_9BILA|nr:hypothetical protein QR680_014441 [Steinernema hermaphroditum]